MIKTKTLREPSSARDGTRVYIGRRYPRGVKDNVLWNERIHDLGPSLDLHRAVLHEGLALDEYDRRFRTELAGSKQRDLLRMMAERSTAGETITLLCDHPKGLPAERCHRFVVKELIDAEAANATGQG